jgi:hypothetical protein
MLHNVNNLNLNTFLLLKIMENSLMFEPIIMYSVGLAYFHSNFYGDYLSKSSIYYIIGGFIKGILRGVRCTKSLRVLFLHRRPPSWTTLVLYSRAVLIFNEPALSLKHKKLLY